MSSGVIAGCESCKPNLQVMVLMYTVCDRVIVHVVAINTLFPFLGTI